jgi:hypothetical protein
MDDPSLVVDIITSHLFLILNTVSGKNSRKDSRRVSNAILYTLHRQISRVKNKFAKIPPFDTIPEFYIGYSPSEVAPIPRNPEQISFLV